MTTTTSEQRKRTLTPEHKEALAKGRQQGKIVRAYLEAISDRPRGRRISKVDLEARLDQTLNELESDELDPVNRVKLIQERINLEKRLARYDKADLGDLEKGFIEAAKPWAESHGVTYVAFKQAGVPDPVLRAAGLAKAS